MPREREEIEEDEDDRPRKKKKKKKKEAKSNSNMYLFIAVGGGLLVSLLVCGGVAAVMLTRSGKGKLTPVTAYVNYASPEDVFHVDLPQGWDQQSGGKKNLYFVEATRGSATIKVNENLIGSLVGDIAGALDRNPNPTDEELPVWKVHAFKKRVYEEEFSKFEEDHPIVIRNGFGKSVRSTFTAKVGFTKVKGYRMTAVSALNQITATCYCAQSDWDICEPAFARAIASAGNGPGKVPSGQPVP